ncbi:MAG: proline dehydrogenase [Pseudonocardiales bacterium]|nr:proline dehydrogenase [Pseudonocardiales bacterium]
MANAMLLKLSHSDRVRRLTTRLPVTRTVVERFVSGENDSDVLATVRELQANGLTATIDRLGEDVSDRASADATATAYVKLLRKLSTAGLVPTAEVSLKLSAMGQALGADGHSIALANARRVCEAAAEIGTTVSIDMEDHTTVDRTLATVMELRTDFPWVAAVLQAALRRTEADVKEFTASGSRVRLVKGAYAEPSSVAYGQKAEVDASYARSLELLMAGAGYPQIASHDPAMIDLGIELAAKYERTPGSYEFQMLYGIRAAEQNRLRADGHQVRVYVPYGSDWYGYFVRRLAERPANIGFFARALIHR